MRCDWTWPGQRTADRTESRDANINLRFVAKRLLAEQNRAGILDVYRRILRRERVPADGKNPFADTLRLSGIATVANGDFRVRNEIYGNPLGEERLAAIDRGEITPWELPVPAAAATA